MCLDLQVFHILHVVSDSILGRMKLGVRSIFRSM